MSSGAPSTHPNPRPSPLHEDALERLSERVQAIIASCEKDHGDLPDDEFIDLVDLKVECDPLCNRQVRIIRFYVMRDPEVA